MEFKHEPVLLNEVIDSLNIKPEGIYVDGTLGGAGHSQEIAARLDGGMLIGIDRDEDAISAASQRLSGITANIKIVKDNYINIPRILDKLGIQKVDGILLDIGVSSYQLDNPERGFTYREDAVLDMRMDKDAVLTAADIVNGYPREELARIIREYGEDDFANNIARHIVNEREKSPITTTMQLARIVEQAIPAAVKRGRGGLARKTFQALRIEVNAELDVLAGSIQNLIDRLTPQGRLAIITFHSLEDRIVKQEFKRAENPCTCPPQFPVCICGAVPKGRIITKKPIVPSKDEGERNKRATSAKLRVFEKK
ncbi:MAG: 16S rRNA (cytosine(1402)-N(4))-methyltransferase RsmH [Lachnospiraceae bacterium]